MPTSLENSHRTPKRLIQQENQANFAQNEVNGNKQTKAICSRSTGVANLFVVKFAVVGFYRRKSTIYDLQVIKWVNWSVQPMEQINLSTFIAFPSLLSRLLDEFARKTINSSPQPDVKWIMKSIRCDANEVVKCDHENTSVDHKFHEFRIYLSLLNFLLFRTRSSQKQTKQIIDCFIDRC